jgi:hypothetical protein
MYKRTSRVQETCQEYVNAVQCTEHLDYLQHCSTLSQSMSVQKGTSRVQVQHLSNVPYYHSPYCQCSMEQVQYLQHCSTLSQSMSILYPPSNMSSSLPPARLSSWWVRKAKQAVDTRYPPEQQSRHIKNWEPNLSLSFSFFHQYLIKLD